MKKAGKREHLISDINIAPFTDVILVLLIIFMITTPLITQPGIKVELPDSRSSETETNKGIHVMITSSGNFYLDEKKVTLDEMKDLVSRRIQNDSEEPVIVKADRQVQYDNVVRAIDTCKQAGAKRFALAVEKKDTGE